MVLGMLLLYYFREWNMNISTDWITEPSWLVFKVFMLPSPSQRFILQPEDWLWLRAP